MTSFQAIRQYIAKLTAYETKAGMIRRLNYCRTLLILSFTAFQLFACRSAAVPIVTFTGHNAVRFAPHSLPGGIPVGDKVQVIAALDSIDPVFSPTISVEAVQGGTTLMLDRVPPNNPMFDPYHVYYKFIDLDPGLMGTWKITPTDDTGTGFSTLTKAIAEPEFLPLVENVTVQGTPRGVRVTWSLPNLAGFDADAVAVRVIDATSGGHLWESQTLPVQSTSFQPPAGILQAGVDYVYAVILGDWEGSDLENASWAFSKPFHLTVNGDFNLDGTVDAADYVVWRNGLGTIYDQNDFGVWRAHFGTSLGVGSGSAGYPLGASAEPLSAAVPEPASLAVLLLGVLLILAERRKVGQFSRQSARDASNTYCPNSP